MKLLAIETSCDETAVCLIDARGAFGPDFRFSVLGNALLSQVAIHAEYGGVFPSLAKREHAKHLVPLLRKTVPEIAGMCAYDKQKLQELLAREPGLFDQLTTYLDAHARPEIDVIAVTYAPGLEPALWVGVNFAKALSLVWNMPLVAVNHLEGHIAMALTEKDRLKHIAFPSVALLISGGHTELDLVEAWPKFRILGETRDDAVGEAFDKVARMMGLPYPGGPEISRLAASARQRGGSARYTFPRPMLDQDNYDFSFSGLKTEVRKRMPSELTDEIREDIAMGFENAASDVLVGKTVRAAEEFGAQNVVIGGGVSANTHIRAQLAAALERVGCPLLCPSPEWATDNALMIALAGYFRALHNEFADPHVLTANGNLRLGAD